MIIFWKFNLHKQISEAKTIFLPACDNIPTFVVPQKVAIFDWNSCV